MTRTHPSSTYWLCLIEWLERTAYYGMRALLVLCLVAPLDRGGFGWRRDVALYWYGLFTGAVWCTPFFAGFLIDRWLGLRRAVFLGAGLLLAGYVMLLGALLLPDARTFLGSTTLRALCAGTDAPLGTWSTIEVAVRCLESAVRTDTEVPFEGTLGALRWTATLLWVGLGLLIVGNAFFKPSVALLVGMGYPGRAAIREQAYLLYYLAIYAAVLVAGVGVGTIGERVGWSAGLVVSCAFICVALAFCVSKRRMIAELASGSGTTVPDVVEPRLSTGGALLYIGAHALIAMLFWAAYEQSGGLMTLFVAEQVNRRVAGFEVPATWFFSLTAVVAVLVSVPLARAVAVWETRSGEVTPPTRFALGLLWGAAAYVVVAIGSTEADAVSVSVLWPIAFYVLLTIGELLFSPCGFAMAGRYAPVRQQSAFMGLWLLSIALGSYLGGMVGAWSERVGRPQAFAALAVALGVGALVMLLVRRPLERLTRHRAT